MDLTRTVQQIYEEERTKQRAESDTVMSDFAKVKSTLSRFRTIKNNKNKATTINEIVVDNKETSKGENFLIHDNQKRNRNLVFSSPTGFDTDVSDSEDDEADDSDDETDDFDDEPLNESIEEISNAVEKSLIVNETETSTLTETVAATVVTFDPSNYAK